MKKFVSILILLILSFPVIVKAAVDENTGVGLYNTRAECETMLDQNDDLANKQASNGYYLTCLEVTCNTNIVAHNDLAPFASNVTCANGNTNPFLNITQSGITLKQGIDLGDSCSTNDQDLNYLADTYATVLYQYNCVQDSDGGIYISPNNTSPINITNTSTNSDKVKSPATGINTYYIALGSIAVILSIGLYIVNKKNLFKKI
ncbi:MAG: hypothetical protein PHD03_01570 [Bacilli bacterium]|nr:hypothetical protein [Bacilli bacterium]MDD4406841.1 hypothetical protein [Bacilli bacterium]